jgi:hypothetical protein
MRGRTLVLGAVVATLALCAPVDAIADQGRGPAPRPALLAHAGHGHSVVEALGARLPAVAATNRMSETRLRGILESDPTAWIGQDGQLFYVEKAEALTAQMAAVPAALATYPESQTFALHSLPGSTHTIFLDFDGANVTGTWWNAYGGMPAQTYTGFTLDGDPSTFTSAEKAYIQTVWRIVAEKYAAFDVDVTTADPGPAGYNRNGSLDLTYGDHVVITDDATAVSTACAGACSGIALLDTFDDTWRTDAYLEPAWVFSSMTSQSPVLTAHTVAHEVGHTFGLSHDGDATHSYYGGQSNWFPLMGSSARAVGQFSKGEYTGANNTEDDLAMIAANGAPLRLDDHSDLTLLAEPLATGSVVGGVISTRSDRDVFAVDHDCTTDLTARATGIGAGASLDLSVTVLAADGTTVGTADPTSGQITSVWPYVPTGMDASLTVPAANALYYVAVDGVGKGDPATNGYSDYGSIGQYELAISGCDGSMPTITTMPTPTTTGATAGTTVRVPSAPRIGLAASGKRGRPITAKARWAAPLSTGGASIIGYRVTAQRLDRTGRVLKSIRSALLSSSSHALKMRLAKGRYRFRVVAYNRVGGSPYSAASVVVRAR